MIIGNLNITIGQSNQRILLSWIVIGSNRKLIKTNDLSGISLPRPAQHRAVGAFVLLGFQNAHITT